MTGIRLEVDASDAQDLEGVPEEEEFGLHVDPGALCRRTKPGKSDFHGTPFGAV